MRRLVAALAALAALSALSALPLPASAVPAPEVRAWVIERTSPHAAAFEIIGRANVYTHRAEYAYAAMAVSTVRSGRLADVDGVFFRGVTGDNDARVDVPGTAGVRCSAVPHASQLCAQWNLAYNGLLLKGRFPHPSFDRVFVVMRGRDPVLRFASNTTGWWLRPLRGSVREVAGDAAYAHTPRATAAAYTESSAPGGAWGSVAFGYPPCATTSTVRAGAGTARLTGGTREVVADCPGEPYPPAAAADRTTTWRLSGTAAGLAEAPVRLVVLDLPRKV